MRGVMDMVEQFYSKRHFFMSFTIKLFGLPEWLYI